MDKMNVIKQKDKELAEQLTAYQNASAEMIAAHLCSHRKAILADEVGLGKTFVAKRVISLLAKEYYEKESTPEKPFRVAYICPNLQVAEQNFPKLSIYSDSTLSDTQKEKIYDAFEGYKETISNIKKLKNIDRYLNDNVFVLIRDWASGTVELPEHFIDHYKTYSKKRNDINAASANMAKLNLLEALCDVFCISKKGADNYFKEFYYLSKRVFNRLKSDVHEDYRLTKQHLYSLEADRRSSGAIMQLESLTPSTSFKTDFRSGTADERALIAATLVIGGKADDNPNIIKALLEEKGIDPHNTAFEEYKKRLNDIGEDKVKSAIKELDINGLDIPSVRQAFAAFNADKFLEYDLVIMDEFQNFKQLFDKETKAGEITGSILNKESCKVLMLSATPFSADDIVSAELSEECSPGKLKNVEQTDANADFFTLMEFMGADDSWKKSWTDARSKSNTAKCERLLLEKGIFRTERALAAKYPGMIRIDQKCPLDFNSVITNNFLLSSESYAVRYSVDTPFPGDFAYGYDFAEKAEDMQNRSLTLSAEQLRGENDIPRESLPVRYQSLEDRLLGSDDTSRIQQAALLWIPPSGCKLDGTPFKGLEGFSKKLIFTQFQMTPKAFTFLLCARVKQIQTQNAAITAEGYDSCDYEKIRAVLEDLMPKSSYPMTSKALLYYCTDLFVNNKAAVRLMYPKGGYIDAVGQYCRDLCFADMISEYLQMLADEKGGKDMEMQVVVNRVRETKPAECSLFCSDKPISPAGLYAAGLYPNGEKAVTNGQIRRLKDAFNSPFYPFVFTTTSIGTEGIDLHWYARHVIHWSVPAKAVDLEQREGRVLRRNCHSVRLTRAYLAPKKEDCINDGWLDSDMFDMQVNYTERGKYKVTRETFFEDGSPEQELYEQALDIVSAYHSMLGSDPNSKADPLDLSPYSHINRKSSV